MLTSAMKELLGKTGRLSTKGLGDVDGLISELKAAGFEASLDSSKEWIVIPESQVKKACGERYSRW